MADFNTIPAALAAWQAAQQRFVISLDPRELDPAVEAALRAIDLSGDQDAGRAAWQGMAAMTLLARYEAGGDAADMDKSIELAQTAVSSGVGEPSQRARWLSTLALGLAKRSTSAHAEGDLDDALAAAREAVDTVTETDGVFPQAASDLLIVLMTSFNATEETEQLAEAIESGRKSVGPLAPNDPRRPMFQSRLEMALAQKEEYLRRVGPAFRQAYDAVIADRAVVTLRELDLVIDDAEQILVLLEPPDPLRGAVLAQLADLLSRRFERSTALADLDESIAADRECLSLLPAEEKEMHWFISERLSGSLRRRYQAANDPGTQRETIAIARAWAAAAPPGDPVYAYSRMLVAQLVSENARRGGDRSTVTEAVEAAELAVSSGQLTGIAQANAQYILAGALWARAEHSGSTSDLDAAIAQAESALAVHATGVHLGFLSTLLATRALRTGSDQDLDVAIEHFESAIGAYGYPAGSGEPPPPGLDEDLGNLGLAYLRRYERLGALADLEASVDRGRAAIRLAQHNRFTEVGTLGNLAYALARRYERFDANEDLTECIELLERAVSLLDQSIAGLNFLKGNLAAALLIRNGYGDADRAVALSRSELEAPGLTSDLAAGTQRTLCMALTRQFEHDGSLQAIGDAIEAGRTAARLAPAGGPTEAGALSVLGLAYRARYESALRLPEDRAGAIAAFRRASSIDGAPPRQRALDAQRWAVLAMEAAQYPDAVAGFTASIGMLAQVIPRRLKRADQEHELAVFSGIGSLAAACCLETGDVSRAVELWEHGRGLLQSEQLDSRSELTDLAAAHPGLAERFTGLSNQLDDLGEAAFQAGLQSGASAAPAPSTNDDARRVRLARELTDCIRQIRAQPGFDRFLQAPPILSLRQAAAGGPVVLLNVTSLRADAIVLGGATAETVIPLSGLTPALVEERVRAFLGAVHTTTSHRSSQAAAATAAMVVSDTLRWLYDTIAAPVLDRLGFAAGPAAGSAGPRLWWCPSGLLSLLPLHAAGYHLPEPAGARRTVIDRVVSSYTPTLRSLLYTSAATVAGTSPGPGQLIVSMPYTPGAADLPGAADEAKIVKAHAAGPVTELTGSAATRGSVLAQLDGHANVHFACHAASDLNNPSTSHLLLSDHQTRALTVLEVSRKRLNGDLAVLSACSTARPGTRLVDEVIHLSSGFQLAGYRHVVATMWPLADRVASVFAEHLYSVLTNDGPLNPDRSAQATHQAIQAIRAAYLDKPLIWAPFLHLGP